MATKFLRHSDELYHHGILGMHWGIRRYQNKDGSLTPAGQRRYNPHGYDVDSYERGIKSGKYKKYYETRTGPGGTSTETIYKDSETGELHNIRRSKKGVYEYAGKHYGRDPLAGPPKPDKKTVSDNEGHIRREQNVLRKAGLNVVGQDFKFDKQSGKFEVKSPLKGVKATVSFDSKHHKEGFEKRAASFINNAKKEDSSRREDLRNPNRTTNKGRDPYEVYKAFAKKSGIKPVSREMLANQVKLVKMEYSGHDHGKSMVYTIPGTNLYLSYYQAPGYLPSGWGGGRR